MIKIELVKESFWRDSYFSFRSEELHDSSAFRITLFGKTFRIKYSKKFNYFLIAYKAIRLEKYLDLQRVVTGKLAQLVLEQALEKEGIAVSNLEILLTDGRTPGFNFKGLYEGVPVFIKLNIYSTPPSKKFIKSYLQTEYENGLLFSSDCPYCLKPIKYLELPQFELLITPFVENAQTLHDCMRGAEGLKEKYFSQLQEVREYMKKNNLAHGDLHGSNILIGTVEGGEEQIYIIDFTAAQKLSAGEYINSPQFKSDEKNFNRFFNTILEAKARKR